MAQSGESYRKIIGIIVLIFMACFELLSLSLLYRFRNDQPFRTLGVKLLALNSLCYLLLMQIPIREIVGENHFDCALFLVMSIFPAPLMLVSALSSAYRLYNLCEYEKAKAVTSSQKITQQLHSIQYQHIQRQQHKLEDSPTQELSPEAAPSQPATPKSNLSDSPAVSSPSAQADEIRPASISNNFARPSTRENISLFQDFFGCFGLKNKEHVADGLEMKTRTEDKNTLVWVIVAMAPFFILMLALFGASDEFHAGNTGCKLPPSFILIFLFFIFTVLFLGLRVLWLLYKQKEGFKLRRSLYLYAVYGSVLMTTWALFKLGKAKYIDEHVILTGYLLIIAHTIWISDTVLRNSWVLYRLRLSASAQDGVEEEGGAFNLSKFIMTDLGYEYFHKHVLLEFSSENLSFFRAVEHFRLNPSYERACEILENYILDTAVLQVNLPAPVVQDLKAKLKVFRARSLEITLGKKGATAAVDKDISESLMESELADIFSASRAIVLELMEGDTLRRFLQSNLYEEYLELKAHKGKKKEKKTLSRSDSSSSIGAISSGTAPEQPPPKTSMKARVASRLSLRSEMSDSDFPPSVSTTNLAQDFDPPVTPRALGIAPPSRPDSPRVAPPKGTPPRKHTLDHAMRPVESVASSPSNSHRPLIHGSPSGTPTASLVSPFVDQLSSATLVREVSSHVDSPSHEAPALPVPLAEDIPAAGATSESQSVGTTTVVEPSVAEPPVDVAAE